MSTPNGTNGANPIDKTVRRLDDFPELVHALRDGDLLTGRLFCAQLFDCDGRRSRFGEMTPTPEPQQALTERYPNLYRFPKQ